MLPLAAISCSGQEGQELQSAREPADDGAPSALTFESMAEYCDNRVPQLLADPVGGLPLQQSLNVQNEEVIGHKHIQRIEDTYRCRYLMIYEGLGGQTARLELIIEVDPVSELPTASDYVELKQEQMSASSTDLVEISFGELSDDAYFANYQIQPEGTPAYNFSEQFIGSPGSAGWIRVTASTYNTDLLTSPSLSTPVRRVVDELPARLVADSGDVDQAAADSVDSSDRPSAGTDYIPTSTSEISESELFDFCSSPEIQRYVTQLYADLGLQLSDEARFGPMSELMRSSGSLTGCSVPNGFTNSTGPTDTGSWLFFDVNGQFFSANSANARTTYETFARPYANGALVELGPDGLYWAGRNDADGSVAVQHVSVTDIAFLNISLYYVHHDGPRLPIDVDYLHHVASELSSMMPGTSLVAG